MRYIANSSPTTREIRDFMTTRKRREISRGSGLAKFAGAVVLVAGLAITGQIILSKRAPTSIEVNGSSAMMQKGFCAVKCSKGGNGAFYSNEAVYVEDWSDEKRYRKKFYDKKENLLVEGIGNDNERWFFNPNHKGEAKLAKTHKLGETWTLAEDVYTGGKAVQKWSEVKVNY